MTMSPMDLALFQVGEGNFGGDDAPLIPDAHGWYAGDPPAPGWYLVWGGEVSRRYQGEAVRLFWAGRAWLWGEAKWSPSVEFPYSAPIHWRPELPPPVGEGG